MQALCVFTTLAWLCFGLAGLLGLSVPVCAEDNVGSTVTGVSDSPADRFACSTDSAVWMAYRERFDSFLSDFMNSEKEEGLRSALSFVLSPLRLRLVRECTVGVIGGLFLLAKRGVERGGQLAAGAGQGGRYKGGGPLEWAQRAFRLLHLAQIFVFVLRNGNLIPEEEGSRWGGVTAESLLSLMQSLREVILQHRRQKAATIQKVSSDFRYEGSRVGVVSVCAYDDRWVLKNGGVANRNWYVAAHSGYEAVVLQDHPLGAGHRDVDIQHSKLALLARLLRSGRFDFVLWTDCDSVVMNREVTVDSIVRQAEILKGDGGERVDFCISEEHWGLSSANFIVRNSEWSIEVLEKGYELLRTQMPLFGDQDALIFLLMSEAALSSEIRQGGDSFEEKAAVVPQESLNSYDSLNAALMGCRGYEDGDFIVTFPGCRSFQSCNPLFLRSYAESMGRQAVASLDRDQEEVDLAFSYDTQLRLLGPPDVALRYFGFSTGIQGDKEAPKGDEAHDIGKVIAQKPTMERDEL
uniref:Nucleotide-diphospho-sugar transferase domain-containing protein n=1 Tax=Chromera velia CCMP2878 TaxID=1169474 RepID=A0A0G4IDK1_9ALVE|eukprot:Cvel_2361.t1-p1 / transcript=Cvel_2361.t1 / gene=Cvel_2361 / organism=Chromera_velia_CCMP2878 / gene_product=Uncharacterized alpha-1,2-galactosyltransferase, putative / transcript_product=Uncharacterized alpha-1,2-galactosyltransferase, putative / location=Cvel_scaffold91:108401-115800(-) / protein_length=521 / sequence_SO=supercontig / SO=protein_coding / is_pseudo=false